MIRAGARKLSNRNGYWYIGKTPDPSSGEMIASEGSLESDFLCQLLTDWNYGSVQSQPVKIRYLYLPSGQPQDVELLDKAPSEDQPSLLDNPETKRSTYTPDFKVVWKSGETWLVEVKSEKYLQDPKVARKKAVGEAYAATLGWKFRMITDMQIRAEPSLSNAKIQRRYRGMRVPSEIESRILEEVRRVPGVAVGALAEHLGASAARSVFEPYLYAMIAQHKLSFDDTRPLGRRSGVFIPRGSDANARIF